MTTADSPFSTEVLPSGLTQDAESPWLARLEQWLERGSEWLNPILVKEARQAMKSRQFLITFTLVLVCGWAWSLLGVALMSPGIYYSPGGPFMLVGYYFVIAVPLLVVVPFAAFRSLAAEREDGTFELLSITALSSRQIVTGKLGSAVLQMLVYYSAMSPCIAFTYLLRGVDIITIILLLAYTFLASLILSVVGLLIATLSTARAWQVLFSVLLLLGLLAAGSWWSMVMMLFLNETPPLDQPAFWMGNLAALSGYASYFVLFLFAAAGLISFASDNRATRLRWVMLAQQVLLVGWFVYLWTEHREFGVLYGFTACSAIHWMVMGSLMIGETAQLSPRVRRSLPQSFFGRMTLTWFNPGSGTGYMFALSTFGAAVLLMVVCGVYAMGTPWQGRPQDFHWFWFTLLSWCYVAIYLGAGRLLFLMLKPFYYVGLLFTFLIEVLMVSAGAALPFFLALWLGDFSQPEYSVLQSSNWMWTLYEVGRNGVWGHPSMVFVVLSTAVLVFVVNMFLAVREVEQVRTEAPRRVIEDDCELHPERFELKRPRTPWDEDLEPPAVATERH